MQLSGAMVAVVLSMTHVAIFLPAGLTNILFYLFMKTNGPFISLSAKFWALFVVFRSATAIVGVVDFLVYFTRIKAFRDWFICQHHT